MESGRWARGRGDACNARWCRSAAAQGACPRPIFFFFFWRERAPPPRLQPPRVPPRPAPSGDAPSDQRDKRGQGRPVVAERPSAPPTTARARPRRSVVPTRRRSNAPAPDAAARARPNACSEAAPRRGSRTTRAARPRGWEGTTTARRGRATAGSALAASATLKPGVAQASPQRRVGAVLLVVACVGATHPTGSRQRAIDGCVWCYLANNWGYISRYGGQENLTASPRGG